LHNKKDLNMTHSIDNIPTWVKILVFFLILGVLGIFGDLFTFIVGTLITTLIFANGYDADNLHEH
jgi:hypothetical protein